ncbi:MAG: hypothetical protein HYY24_00845 [Verrucomicrobia bacterium]|nr:hypothetical protein [Verrucomicrobiota bacterium]
MPTLEFEPTRLWLIVRTPCASPDELRAPWTDAGQRDVSLAASTGGAGVRCRIRNQQAAVFNYFAPDVLKVPAISPHGNVAEILGEFGGADQLRPAGNQLQSLLYAA